MKTSMQSKLTQVQTALLGMLELERTSTGLLSDVEDVYYGPKININQLNYPSIWIIEDTLQNKENSKGPRSVEYDALTVGFFCLDYDTDAEDSYKLSKNLASRVVDTIEQHCLIQDTNNEQVFDYIRLVSLEPAEFPVSSSNTITQCGVTMEFGFSRRRTICGAN